MAANTRGRSQRLTVSASHYTALTVASMLIWLAASRLIAFLTTESQLIGSELQQDAKDSPCVTSDCQIS